MSLKVYAALGALLGVALSGAGGFYAGVEWQRGREAITSKQELLEVVETYRRESAATAQDFRTAADRLQTISADYQEVRDANDGYFHQLKGRWDGFWRAHPDLADCRIGADGLRLWNDANRGAGAADAATADPGGSAPPVPAAADRDR
jgi:hypothetical protein